MAPAARSRSRSPRTTPAKLHRETERDTPPKEQGGAAPLELRDLKAYVVCLDRRPDRWARCETMLRRETPWLPCTRFSASDGSKMSIPEDEICTVWNTRRKAHYGDYDEWVYDAPGCEKDGQHWAWKPPAEEDAEWGFEESGDSGIVTSKLSNETFAVKKVFAERYRNPGQLQRMSAGERGCAHSHRRLWEIIAKRTVPTLVLEDDVQICFERTDPELGRCNGDIFTERLRLAVNELPSDFDVLYLGWSGWRGGNFCLLQEECRGKFIRKAEYVWTTVAYILTPAAARKLLAAACPMDEPVDEFMAWEASQGRLKSFVVVDEGDGDDTWAGGIVDQADFYGDSDIKKSDGGAQGDDGADFAVAVA